MLENRRGAAPFVALALAAFLSLAMSIAAADEPAPQVVFMINRTTAEPGSLATLLISVKTDIEIWSMSFAIDFDESKLRVFDVSLPERAPPAVTDGSTSISFSNVDSTRGNQSSEGWIHLEVTAAETDSPLLPAAINSASPVARVRFLVLHDAPEGFTPVEFKTVGPIGGFPTAYFVNRVLAGADLGTINDSEPQVEQGGIDIIGEVGFFMRGDANFDEQVNLSDAVHTLGFLFLGGMLLPCPDASDANDDGRVTMFDSIFTLQRLFLDAGPFPDPAKKGKDPTPDELECPAGR